MFIVPLRRQGLCGFYSQICLLSANFPSTSKVILLAKKIHHLSLEDCCFPFLFSCTLVHAGITQIQNS